MSETALDNISIERIRRLMNAVGVESMEEAKQNIEALDYNWRQPHFFSQQQLDNLNRFTKTAATTIAENFETLYHCQFEVQSTTATLYFAYDFLNKRAEEKEQCYYLAFGPAEAKPCGFVAIPIQAAVTWTRNLLGDFEVDEETKTELSELEESLLLDIADALIQALNGHEGNCNFQPDLKVVRDRLPFDIHGSEELCKIVFDIERTDLEKSSKMYFLTLCNALEPVVGKSNEIDTEHSPEDISQTMLQHAHEMPVTVTAQLDSAMLTFNEVMNLSVDDIVMLDKRVDEPIQLILDDKAILLGRPAKSAGKYAMAITQVCDEQ